MAACSNMGNVSLVVREPGAFTIRVRHGCKLAPEQRMLAAQGRIYISLALYFVYFDSSPKAVNTGKIVWLCPNPRKDLEYIHYTR